MSSELLIRRTHRSSQSLFSHRQAQNKALTGFRASIQAAKLGQAVQKRLFFFLRLPSALVSYSGAWWRAHVCHESVTERDSDKKTNGRGARPQKNCVYELFNFSS